jgi:hypothetical protein
MVVILPGLPGSALMSTSVCFFYWQIFSKFQRENYDFNLYKGFFMGKKVAQIHQNSN